MNENTRSKLVALTSVLGLSLVFGGLYLIFTSRPKSKKGQISKCATETSSQSGHNDVPDNGKDNTLDTVSQQAASVSRRNEITDGEAAALTYAMKNSTIDKEKLQPTLTTIANAAAFTTNQDKLRDAGCLDHIQPVLTAHVMAMQIGLEPRTRTSVIVGLTTAINNLAVNQENQKHLKDCIPSLIDLATLDQTTEDVQLGALEALTNLALTDTHHQPYTRIIQQLYIYLQSSNPAVRIQTLRLLNNLSTNADMVPHLLAAKAPTCVFEFLEPRHVDEGVILRWLTLLANVLTTARELKVTCATLPTQYKAPSPETMYAALYGQDSAEQLKSKVFVLSKSGHEEIRHHATRVYTELHERAK